jgi:hypothetical protein
MRLPTAIGAVVVGYPSTFHTPLSGQISPVRTRVPMGRRVRTFIGRFPYTIAFRNSKGKTTNVRAEAYPSPNQGRVTALTFVGAGVALRSRLLHLLDWHKIDQ